MGLSKDDVINFYKWFDMFAFVPVPRHHSGRLHESILGATVSWFIFICVVIYGSNAAEKFIHHNVSVNIATSQPTHIISKEMVPFEARLPHIADPRYFHVEVLAVSVNAEASHSAKTPVETFSAGHDMIQVRDAALPLSGNCQLQACKFVRMKVYPCMNDTNKHTVKRSSAATCAPVEEINDIINNNYMRVELNMTIEGNPILEHHDISLKDGMSIKTETFFTKYDLTVKPDFFHTWSQRHISELKLTTTLNAIDRLPRPKTGDDQEYIKFDLLLDGGEILEVRNKMTLFDLIGKIFAFNGALGILVRYWTTRYNAKGFFGKYPGWLNVADHPWEQQHQLCEGEASNEQELMSSEG